MKYLDLCKKIEDKECNFLWTEDVFSNKFVDSKTNIDIVSKCGHNTTVQCSNFLYCNTGVTCKNCNYKFLSESNRNIESNKTLKEYNVLKALQNYLQCDVDIKLSLEGCLSDIALKPKNVDKDLWLPVQVKITQKVSHGIYSFNIKNKCKNIILLLFAIDDQRIWILDSNDVNVNKISIGKNTSVYSKYEIQVKELKNTLITLYNTNVNYLKILEEINVQPSKQCFNSFKFYNYREQIFKTLKFTYPEIKGTIYDLIINDRYKIQDKVATTYSKRGKLCKSIIVNVSRHRKYNKLSYKLGDNDFYWIHLPDKSGAYIIPENVLYDNNIIFEENNIEGNYTITLYPYHTNDELLLSNIKSSYANKYLYFYNNKEHIDAIINIFSSTEKPIIEDNYKCPITIVEK